jgi:hypothetical protein
MPLIHLLAALAAASFGPLHAQGLAAKRPRLPPELDTNGARAYHQWGNRRDVDWKKAYDAYYWAWRLEPSNAYHLHAMYLALWNRQPWEWRRAHDAGAAYVQKSKEARLIRDPFPHFSNTPCYLIPELNLDRQRDRFLAGMIHYENGCYPRANEAFAQALDKDPTLLGVHVYRARGFFFQREYDSTVAQLNVLLDSLRARDLKYLTYAYNSKAMFEYMIGIARVRQNQWGAARDAFGRALTEDLAFYMAMPSSPGWRKSRRTSERPSPSTSWQPG